MDRVALRCEHCGSQQLVILDKDKLLMCLKCGAPLPDVAQLLAKPIREVAPEQQPMEVFVDPVSWGVTLMTSRHMPSLIRYTQVFPPVRLRKEDL